MPMPGLPAGTITFLFTDIEGSTRLLEHLGDRYAPVLADCRRVLREAVQARGGHEVSVEGDAGFFVFSSARDALAAAVAAQQALCGQPVDHGAAVRVRAGLHTGEAVLAGEAGYVGMDVHRAARICAAGHGGQILLSRATCELVEHDLPPGVGLRDLGEHRLKDLARPHHLFQALGPGLPAEFPPLRTLEALPNNLPRQLTSFIGREQEMAELKRLLASASLVTLSGTGGAGKTRLALQLAADLLDEYAAGVSLVELADVSDPTLVPKAVAAALGVPEQPGRDLTESLVDYLHPKSMLLVLDNCEHLTSACAHLADTLLQSCPTLRILATSRESLGIPGETVWRIPPLSIPDPSNLGALEDLTRYEAVRLFVERATAHQPGRTLPASSVTTVAKVCTQLDGIPLAIELAAARVRVLAVEQIADRLSDRFRLLTGGGRTAPPRLQTLRAAMDWSYDLLSVHERAVLRRLSIFVGGCTLEAAEAVCAGHGVETPDVIDHLAQLVDKSLVMVEIEERGARYRLLETVRQYGLVKLEETGEISEARRRHLHSFLNLAERAKPAFHGPEQSAWLERLETEHGNLRAALESSKADKDGAEMELRIAAALSWFWFLHGHSSEGRQWLEHALSREATTAPVSRAEALSRAGALAWRHGDYARAAELAEDGVALSRRLPDTPYLGDALEVLGFVALGREEYERADAAGAEALALHRARSDARGISSSLTILGAVAEHRGDHAQASALHEESLAVRRAHGDRWGIQSSLRILGGLAARRGDYAQAVALYTGSLALARELKNTWGLAACLEGLAGLSEAMGQPERAARLFGIASALRAPTHVPPLPLDRASYERTVARVRATLEEDIFSTAWEEGRRMTLEQAVEYALAV
jgi:predicted ATPase/class 3 adenylate cyclase